MTRSIGRCDQQRVPSLYTESTVRTDVGSSSTDSCIGYLPFLVFSWPFWLAVGYPRPTPAKRMSAEVCRSSKPGTTKNGYGAGNADREGCRMPQQAWSEKRERQYQHIKEGLREQGRSEDTAEEIAARTVNKERARSGEAGTASRTSVEDISSGRRGGLRSHRGPGGRTYRQLYEEAKDRGIDGRSRMSKQQLERALERRS